MSRLLLAIAALAIVLAACDAEAAPPSTGGIGGGGGGHPATLAGTSWVVAAIGGAATPRDGQPSMGFDGSSVKGSAGCNSFGGRYQYDPATGELRFQELGMTAMACAEPLRNEVERAFTLVIGQPGLVASLDADGHLVLASAAGGRLDLVVVGPTVTD
jgi:heat shock protein HslJ